MSYDKSPSPVAFYAETAAGAETVAYLLLGGKGGLLGTGRRIVTSRSKNPDEPGWLVEIRNDIHAPVQAEELGCTIFVHQRANEASTGTTTQAFGGLVVTTTAEGRTTARIEERARRERESLAQTRTQAEASAIGRIEERARHQFEEVITELRETFPLAAQTKEEPRGDGGPRASRMAAAPSQARTSDPKPGKLAAEVESVIAQCRSALAKWDEGTAQVGEVHDALSAALGTLERGMEAPKSRDEQQALAVHTADRLRLQAEQMTQLFSEGLKIFKLTQPQRDATRKVLLRIGSWTNSRFDQHLRHEICDEDANAVLRALHVLGVLPSECDPSERIRRETVGSTLPPADAHLQLAGVADVVIPGRRPGDVDEIVAALAACWPIAVAHDLTGDLLMLSGGKRFEFCSDEIFIYRNRESFDSWQQEGATAENAASMVHILLGPSSITLVGERRLVESLRPPTPTLLNAQADGWKEVALAERERCAQAIEKAKRTLAQGEYVASGPEGRGVVHNAAAFIRALPAPSLEGK